MAKPWSKATTKVVARRRFYESALEAGLDRDGVLQIKTRRMFKRELENTLERIARRAKRIVSDKDLYRTGNMLRSIEPTQIKRVHAHRIAGSVRAGGPTAPYAEYVHNGSRPHIIAAKPGKYLAFDWKGRTGRVVVREQAYTLVNRDAVPIPGKFNNTWGVGPIKDRRVVVDSVNHPGFGGYRFLNRAANEVVGSEGGRARVPRGARLSW